MLKRGRSEGTADRAVLSAPRVVMYSRIRLRDLVLVLALGLGEKAAAEEALLSKGRLSALDERSAEEDEARKLSTCGATCWDYR